VVDSECARILLERIYQPLGCPILITNISTAELTKHAANAFLSTKISFINMVADMCETIGADVTQVALGMGLDPRIGSEFLKAGIGFGGHCFPKDLRALMCLAREHDVDCGLLKEVENINVQRTAVFLKKIRRALWVLKGKKIGVLGLAFKGGTDDTRESPALRIVNALLEEGAQLRAHDPQAIKVSMQELPPQDGRLEYCSSPYDVAREADALLILTEWQEYRELDFTRLHELMEVPIIIDGRNLLDPDVLRASGFEYVDVGRVPLSPEAAPSAESESEGTGGNLHAEQLVTTVENAS